MDELSLPLELPRQFDMLLAGEVDPVAAGLILQRLAAASSANASPANASPANGSPANGSEVTSAADVAASADPPEKAADHATVWLALMRQRVDQLIDSDPAVLGGLLRLIHVTLLRDGAPPDLDVDAIGRIARALSDETPNRHLLLHLLAIRRDEAALALLTDLLADSPPRGWMAAGQILSPLMQHDDWPVDAVFPRLLDLIGEPALASPILDLANFLVRRGRTTTHPGAPRIGALNALLSGVADRLGRFEESPQSFGDDVQQVQAVLAEAVALAVSTCDAVGLIGDSSAIGALNKSLDLRHRRVQCEAAGALARLGEPVGREKLIALAEEPSARLRAIAYADELGFGDRIDEKFRTAGATAEAEMALWMSQPPQMGVPPTSVETIDSRRMLWPSFSDPVDVHLVRFEYRFGDRVYSNVGLTGPAVFAFSTDVADLPPEDIFAMYAGWHADHDDIFSVPASEFNEVQLRLIQPLLMHLNRSGYEDVRAALLGFFLDETAVICEATRDQTRCVVVTDGLETMDLPTAGRQRPPTPTDLFHLYKGRKMLRTFNPQGIDGPEADDASSPT